MSRPLRFRAWHKIKKKMSEPYGLVAYHPNPIGEVCCPREEDIEVMQFTGLLDKYGKEIYEGYVLKIRDYDNARIDKELFYVFYQDACFNVANKKNNEGFRLGEIYLYCNIVGNIHQNPELLK